MEEVKSSCGGSGGGGGGSSSRPSSTFVKSGDRLMFTVELRPGETTIVSWKKLMREAIKVNGSLTSVPDPPAKAHPNLESRISPGQPAEDEKDVPSRFSAVIEKIERLYMGKHSSDEEDLNDIPDDDQYDTEDSFIDDAELDEYFEVDNSAIKHDGFFVNRGTLERKNDPPILPNQQLKKRRRKDLTKAHGESDDAHLPNTHVQVGKTAVEKASSLLGNNSLSPSHSLAVKNDHSEASGVSSRKKSTETKMKLDLSPSLKVSNGDASLSLPEVKDVEKQWTGAMQFKNIGNKLKDVNGSSNASLPKHHDKSSYTDSISQSRRPLNNADDLESSTRLKDGSHKFPDSYVSGSNHSTQRTKPSYKHKKDGSSVRARGSMLEKAIRELQKMVAESRPPAVENQVADASFQAVKRRLPREIKMKLAKVARLAQATHGEISEDLINRLMSFLGHLIQLRTLKRNLKEMISLGLSAKQEKDDRFQQIKKEIMEMIKMWLPLESKAFEQQAGALDDSQKVGSEEKGVPKRKFTMDTVFEDKICDLYDLYVDGLDEDAAPQIRKLYAELAELWPNGYMDNHGIKRAICRAKERRKAVYITHEEKIKSKKILAPRLEETVQIEGSSVVQAQQVQEKLSNDSGSHGVSSTNKPISSTTAAVSMPSPSVNVPTSLDRLKHKKFKESSTTSPDKARIAYGPLTKKKVTRKPEQELDKTHFRPEKLHPVEGDERPKSHKQDAALPIAPPSL